jgi:hypothetical protein
MVHRPGISTLRGRKQRVALRSVRMSVAIGLTGAACISSADASAQSASTAELTYRPHDTGCADASSFRHLVAARLGFDPFERGASDHVLVDLAMRAGRLQGRVEITRAPGPARIRTLTVDSGECDALAAALATTVAIALDNVRPPQPQPQPQPQPVAVDDPTRSPTPFDARDSHEPTPVATDESAVVAPVPAARSHAFELAAVVGSSVSAALGPAPMLGAEVGLALRSQRVSIEASVRAETTVGTVHVSNGDRLDATVLSAGLAPCAHSGQFAGCALARFGSFQASAPDVATPSLRGQAFAAVGARASYAVSFSPALALRGALEAGFPLIRTSLNIDGAPVWVAPPVFVGVSLSLLAKVL